MVVPACRPMVIEFTTIVTSRLLVWLSVYGIGVPVCFVRMAGPLIVRCAGCGVRVRVVPVLVAGAAVPLCVAVAPRVCASYVCPLCGGSCSRRVSSLCIFEAVTSQDEVGTFFAYNT